MRKPLPSWSDGGVSGTIINFVRCVTNPASLRYVPPDDRIAVFDSDGTLWCERPASALACFVMHRLGLPTVEGVLTDRATFHAAHAGDYAYFQALDAGRLSELLLSGSAGLTPEQFVSQAQAFLRGVLHPRFGAPFGQLTYKPMLELLAFLQGKQFRVFIVTGSGVEFVRAASEALYGVPGERVAGATVDYAMERLDGKILVIRTRNLLGDPGEGEAKVRAIQQRIGRRPILAIGNSAGDRDMLEYTRSGVHSSLCLMLRHDDPVREYAYANEADGKSSGCWTTISMRDDFSRIFVTRDRIARRHPSRELRHSVNEG